MKSVFLFAILPSCESYNPFKGIETRPDVLRAREQLLNGGKPGVGTGTASKEVDSAAVREALGAELEKLLLEKETLIAKLVRFGLSSLLGVATYFF